jgi:hypothetical protein
MYRPTVRYDDTYKKYIDDVFKSTFLDRNQIIRLALFVAAHTDAFKQVLNEYRRQGVSCLPSPSWELWEYGYWLDAEYKQKRRGGNVNADNRRKNGATVINEETSPGRNNAQENRCIESPSRRPGQIPAERIIRNANGGIRITIG